MARVLFLHGEIEPGHLPRDHLPAARETAVPAGPLLVLDARAAALDAERVERAGGHAHALAPGDREVHVLVELVPAMLGPVARAPSPADLQLGRNQLDRHAVLVLVVLEEVAREVRHDAAVVQL